MWTILKYKKNELNILKNDLKKTLGQLPVLFVPKIKYQVKINNKIRYKEQDILEDYLICYHKNFTNKNLFEILKNLRGLKYFLTNFQNSQNEIVKFINYCKNNQDTDGYIKQSFFDYPNIKRGIFMNGPFANMIFNVIENQKDKLKILVGDIKTTVIKNSKNLYRQVQK